MESFVKIRPSARTERRVLMGESIASIANGISA